MKKHIFFLAIIIAVFSSCKKNNAFTIEGQIADAGDNEMLYFEHRGLLKTTMLDSLKLKKDGRFTFSAPRPAYPDLYSIRLKNNQQIILVVDSTETITVNASVKSFAFNNVISNSGVSVQIQDLRASVTAIQEKLHKLQQLQGEERRVLGEEIMSDIDAHKKKAGEVIFMNPLSMAAYYALYQKINNTFIFSSNDKSDYSYYAAVATSFHTFMPDYERSKNIYNYVLEARKKEKVLQERALWNEIAEEIAVGYIDIALPDRNGNERKLSELEGKLTLIDFSAYETAKSVDHTFELRELYNNYHKKGFEIFQVSLDRNKLLWEDAVENIPWICVRDQNGSNTSYVSLYNIVQVPTSFLLNKNGEIIARDLPLDELKRVIQHNL
jgi:peroxiredoxin